MRSTLQFIVASAAASGARELDQSEGCVARAKARAREVGETNISPIVADSFSTGVIVEVVTVAALPGGITSSDEAAKFVKVSASAQTQALFPFSPFGLMSTAASAAN